MRVGDRMRSLFALAMLTLLATVPPTALADPTVTLEWSPVCASAGYQPDNECLEYCEGHVSLTWWSMCLLFITIGDVGSESSVERPPLAAPAP